MVSFYVEDAGREEELPPVHKEHKLAKQGSLLD